MATTSTFVGMRKVTIRNNADSTSAVFIPDQTGAELLEASFPANVGTRSTFAGDQAFLNGVNIEEATLTMLPLETADLGKIFPSGWDATTESWGLEIGGCIGNDFDIIIEKVCDTKSNYAFRHVSISIGHTATISRDDPTEIELTFVPTPTAQTEYGRTGTTPIAYMVYDGTYNPTTATFTFDTAGTGGGSGGGG